MMVKHPELATLAAWPDPFSSPNWLFELKYDGYRALAVREVHVRLSSHQGRDLTAAFPEVCLALSTLPFGTTLDGELVILDSQGHPKFEYLARAWSTNPRAIRFAVRTRPATLMAFDVASR